MSLISVTDGGIIQVTYDPFLLPSNEVFTLASPDANQWQVTAHGGAGYLETRDDTGPYPAAVRKIYKTPSGFYYELLVTNGGILQLSQFASSLVFSPIGNTQLKLSSGALGVGYKLFTYEYDSQTLVDTYKNSDFSQMHTNPVILNDYGLPPSPIFIETGKSYRFILAPSSNTHFPADIMYDWDGVKGGADIDRSNPTEFITEVEPAEGISSSSFTVNGDARRIFTIGRRVRCEDTGVLITYGVVVLSVYDGSITTVAIVVDSDPITVNMTGVRVGILSTRESALPSRRLSGLNTFLGGDLSIVGSNRFNLLPPGIIMYYPVESAGPPPHWLWCDGSYYNSVDYPDLYAAIGTQFGSLGAGNFRVPYVNGSFLMGVEIMGDDPAPRGLVTVASHNGHLAGVVGGMGGIETWQLSIDELPFHNHGSSLNDGTLQNSDESGATNTTSVKRSDFSDLVATGGDGAHSNMPPYRACNIIIHT